MAVVRVVPVRYPPSSSLHRALERLMHALLTGSDCGCACVFLMYAFFFCWVKQDVDDSTLFEYPPCDVFHLPPTVSVDAFADSFAPCEVSNACVRACVCVWFLILLQCLSLLPKQCGLCFLPYLSVFPFSLSPLSPPNHAPLLHCFRFVVASKHNICRCASRATLFLTSFSPQVRPLPLAARSLTPPHPSHPFPHPFPSRLLSPHLPYPLPSSSHTHIHTYIRSSRSTRGCAPPWVCLIPPGARVSHATQNPRQLRQRSRACRGHAICRVRPSPAGTRQEKQDEG